MVGAVLKRVTGTICFGGSLVVREFHPFKDVEPEREAAVASITVHGSLCVRKKKDRIIISDYKCERL